MCGIVGYIGKAQAVPVLVSGLEKLEYRGYDSAGISIFENGKIETIKTKGRLADLEEKIAGVSAGVAFDRRGHACGAGGSP